MLATIVSAALLAAVSGTGAVSADEIMARVAANQDRAREVRKAYVYRQNVLLRLKRTNGKLAREEIRDLVVTPAPKGFDKELTHFEGRYEHKGKLIGYDKPRFTYKELDIDGELADELANEFTADKATRDGIGADLFPLTSAEQKKYTFRLLGREKYQNYDVFRILFQPVRGQDSRLFAGEALVDTAEYEPVLITTHMARGIPLAVRTLLGTNIRQMGFKLEYAKFDEGAWFPVNYGGEFHIRVLFGYARDISISMRNSGFQRVEVSSQVRYSAP